MSYRKKYFFHHKEASKEMEIHHVDFNRKNNSIENLMAVPGVVHDAIHNYFSWWGKFVDVGFLKNKEVVIALIDIFERNKNKEVIMNLEIALRIKDFINDDEKKRYHGLFEHLDHFRKQYHY